MPDPAALASRLAEIRADHVCAWSGTLACSICAVFAAYDGLAEELEETRDLVGRQTAKLASAIAEKARLIEAVLAFAAKYDELRPAMDGAFAFQANHGLPYTGPTWEVERSAMLALARAGRKESR